MQTTHDSLRTVETSLQLTTPVNRCCGDERVGLPGQLPGKKIADELSDSICKRCPPGPLGSQDHLPQKTTVKAQGISSSERVVAIPAE